MAWWCLSIVAVVIENFLLVRSMKRHGVDLGPFGGTPSVVDYAYFKWCKKSGKVSKKSPVAPGGFGRESHFYVHHSKTGFVFVKNLSHTKAPARMKLLDDNFKKYNGWFVTIAVVAAILVWIVAPPVDDFLEKIGQMLPPHYIFFEAQRHWLKLHPLLYVAAAGVYYFISLKLLNARCRKAVNLVFAIYVGLQSLSLLLGFFGPAW